MKRIEQVGLIILGVMVTIGCAITLAFLLMGRELTNEMMFACLAGLVVFFGMCVLNKVARSPLLKG